MRWNRRQVASLKLLEQVPDARARRHRCAWWPALRPAELRQPVVRKLLGDTGIVPTLRRIDLEPFGSDGVRAMAARATGTGTVTEPRVEWLLDASEGNPLVVESLLVEGVWEKGGRARRSATIAESIAGQSGVAVGPRTADGW